MKLIASLTSPYARKVRVILAEKRLPFELVVDSPWEANTRVPEINPLGKVPALVTASGEVFFDSPVIAAYLEVIAPTPQLVPTDPLEAVRVRQLEALADGIADATVTALLESRRPEPQQSAGVIARQIDKVERGLAALEARIAGREWLYGERLGLADLAAGVALAYLDLRLPHVGWRKLHPGLLGLAERLFARPSFVETAPPTA